MSNAQHINAVLDRVLAGMGGVEGVQAASREEYRDLAVTAAGMVRGCMTKARKQKTAGLCLQYLRLSLRDSAATEKREVKQKSEQV
ncbi:hypothetical protein [Stutzerimonas nitrititolerans]|uniref:hypothetical protein n=1 Tax=Stutzerimonas nitrititolerans TaxID=2482751 RepID=UPI00289D8E85|nr:hypothetical protein [Stutzerimonas nitrititolerans]